MVVTFTTNRAPLAFFLQLQPLQDTPSSSSSAGLSQHPFSKFRIWGGINCSDTQVTMANLRTQKRLAAAVLKCGKRKIWLDPNEVNEISNANSRQNIRKLAKDGLIIRKPVAMHSRYRVRERAAAKRLGRHTGPGKRRGTAEARMPTTVPLDASYACSPSSSSQVPGVWQDRPSPVPRVVHEGQG
ncbi:60S ribosomal protein L19-B [Spizellomyces punctatus DAOM BR117]|uniref:Ribosomal protein L19 n=1 Tax=Spizellomyces punctatus (strain DAOM BR117) TaxID=645134 RepID=A0A0L0HKU5_SPIPD|nr:60S ribosomal protein L19-B [Spizellomyces punctatus DAOM BR117]KND01658.1 60S ribosomal protein L19-B [Spizellomyces punctatus DAOM BR117]|eukprot:XP_016609697.1 60S ribosomal protein L19-B [Spizellomyces punctatus DAOM BR117]